MADDLLLRDDFVFFCPKCVRKPTSAGPGAGANADSLGESGRSTSSDSIAESSSVSGETGDLRSDVPRPASASSRSIKKHAKTAPFTTLIQEAFESAGPSGQMLSSEITQYLLDKCTQLCFLFLFCFCVCVRLASCLNGLG
jgi:hypothetical protein